MGIETACIGILYLYTYTTTGGFRKETVRRFLGFTVKNIKKPQNSLLGRLFCGTT